MGFHKHTFPIRMIAAAPNAIEIVSGWVNEDYTIGFHKIRNGKAWAATDVYSGTRIYTGKTRKECAEWIKQNQERIDNCMSEFRYINLVMQFRELIRKELKSYGLDSNIS